jgi:hypothetical protein
MIIFGLQMLDDSEESELLAPWKNVTKWFQAVKAAMNPVFDEVHGTFYAFNKQLREAKVNAITEQS